MEPLSIISLISLVFSIIATGAEMAITEHQNNQNIQLQQDTLHQQQEYATQAAERANDTTAEQYNMLYSPAARRRQLNDANLSVGLMYGGSGSFGQGSTAAQAATPATSLPYINPLLQPGQMGNVMNALKTITEAENTQKDTQKFQSTRPRRARLYKHHSTEYQYFTNIFPRTYPFAKISTASDSKNNQKLIDF